jgi:WD40 repeat protein
MLAGHSGAVVASLFAPDDQTLITLSGDSKDAQDRAISGDGSLKIWDVSDGKIIQSIPTNAKTGLLAIHPQDGLLASMYENNAVRFWDSQNKNYVIDPLTLERPEFMLSPDGKWLAFRQDCDTATSLVNLSETDRLSEQFQFTDGEAGDSFTQNCDSFPGRQVMNFSADGNWFTSANSDQVWDISQSITADAKPVAGTAAIRNNFYQNVSEFSPDGKWLLTGNSASVVYVMQVETAKLNNLPSPDSDVTLYAARNIERRYAFSPNGQWLARALPKSTKIELLDLQGTPILKEKGSLALPKGASVEYLAFSPDNRWLIAHTEAGSFLLWDMTAADPNKTLITLEGFPGLAEAHFSQSGRWMAVYPLPAVAAPVQSGSILLFDMNQVSASAKPIQLPLADTGDVHLVISNDEKWLAAVGKTGDAQLWDLTQTNFAETPLIIPGLGNQVTDVAISQDNSLLAAGTNTGKMLLWTIDDLLAGSTPLILSGGSKAFDHIEFTPDGRWLIGSGPEQPILIWHVQFDEVLALACETIGRNLTRAEWAQYGFTDEYRATCLQWPVEAETTSTP